MTDLIEQLAAIANPAAQLSSAGPLFTMRAALAARLAAVFPPSHFHHSALPAKLTNKEWVRLVRRTPFVGLGWGGVRPDASSGRLLRGTATWTVVLITQHTDVAARYSGDRIAPGAFGLAQVAAAALHGWTIGGDAVTGVGAVTVTDIANLYADDWGDDGHALIGIDLAIPIMLVDAADDLDALLTLSTQWQFDGAATDARTDTISLGS